MQSPSAFRPIKHDPRRGHFGQAADRRLSFWFGSSRYDGLSTQNIARAVEGPACREKEREAKSARKRGGNYNVTKQAALNPAAWLQPANQALNRKNALSHVYECDLRLLKRHVRASAVKESVRGQHAINALCSIHEIDEVAGPVARTDGSTTALVAAGASHVELMNHHAAVNAVHLDVKHPMNDRSNVPRRKRAAGSRHRRVKLPFDQPAGRGVS